MSRFSDDWEEAFPGQAFLWEHNQRLALSGRRGQAFLAEVEAALLALPDERLTDEFADNGMVCALGAVAKRRMMADGALPEQAQNTLEHAEVFDQLEIQWYAQEHFGITGALAAAIAWENDEGRHETDPHDRWLRMLQWVREQRQEAVQP